jgi:hypothetical protein
MHPAVCSKKLCQAHKNTNNIQMVRFGHVYSYVNVCVYELCGTWKNINQWVSPYGLCPQVGDPCHKWNCTLNRSLGTLQPSCSSCSVIPPYKCAMAPHVIVENIHLFQSLHQYQCNCKLWRNFFSARARSVFILCVLRLPVNWVNYTYGRVILCGSWPACCNSVCVGQA